MQDYNINIKINNKNNFAIINLLSKFYFNKFFFIGVIILLLILSVIIHLPNTPGNTVLYKSTKFIMVCILSSYIFFRFYIYGFTLEIDEKIFIIYIFMAILSGLINGNSLYINIIEPLVFGISFIGVSSFWLINRNKNYLILILVLFLIISLIHFSIAFIPNIIKILINHNYKYTIELLQYGNNWVGLHVNTNRIGFSLLVGFFSSCALLFYFIEENKKNLKLIIFLIIISGFFFTGVLISQSRNCTITIIFYVIIELILFSKTIIKKIKKNLPLFLISTSILLFITFILFFYNIFTPIINKTISHGSTYRFSFWEYFIKDQINSFDPMKFFFGAGYSGNINPYAKMINHPNTSVHNFFLENWARFGIFTAIIFTSYLTLIVYKILKNNKFKFLIGIPIAYIMYAFFEDLIFFTYLWMEDFFFLFMLYAQLRLTGNFEKN